jgi:hypothetical protein
MSTVDALTLDSDRVPYVASGGEEPKMSSQENYVVTSDNFLKKKKHQTSPGKVRHHPYHPKSHQHH